MSWRLMTSQVCAVCKSAACSKWVALLGAWSAFCLHLACGKGILSPTHQHYGLLLLAMCPSCTLTDMQSFSSCRSAVTRRSHVSCTLSYNDAGQEHGNQLSSTCEALTCSVTISMLPA